jgi:hypothetical protein
MVLRDPVLVEQTMGSLERSQIALLDSKAHPRQPLVLLDRRLQPDVTPAIQAA